MIRNNRENNLRSVSFGAEMAVRPHSVPREVADLREDVELAFERLEGADNIPVIMHHDVAEIAANGNLEFSLYGINFLAGRGRASLQLGDLTISAAGDAGNLISVVVEAAAGALAVSLDGKKITISPAVGESTWAAVRTALLADADIKALVSVEDDDAGNSTNGAVAEQFLSGGSGDGLVVTAYNVIKGKSVDITAHVQEFSDTHLHLFANAAALGADFDIQNNDIVAVSFESHTAKSNHITATVANN